MSGYRGGYTRSNNKTNIFPPCRSQTAKVYCKLNVLTNDLYAAGKKSDINFSTKQHDAMRQNKTH